MPPAIIGAGIAAAGGVASTAISGSQKRKAQDKALSAAERQQQAAREEQKRLEEKFGLTPGELERQQRVFDLEKKRQAELESRAGQTGEELLRSQGDITSSLLDEISSRQGLTGEELFAREGDINQQFIDQISNFDDKAFQDELDLVLQSVDQEANRRGVFGGTAEGGIRFENLGRAGVDLAVRKATERLNQQRALSEAFVNLAASARGEAGQVGQSALGQSQGARDEISNFLANLQNLDASSKGRAANVALNASGQAQQVSNQFGNVPIALAGADFGQAQDFQNQGLGAIGQAGGTILDELFKKKSVPKKSTIDEFQSFERKPLQGTLERSGGIDLFDSIRGGR